VDRGLVVLVFLTYLMQIESWRRILAGWGQRIAFGPAARTWSVANLGRYVPGRSERRRLVVWPSGPASRRPAAASAFVTKRCRSVAGAVVAAVTPPSAPPLRLALAGLAALATILVLVWRPPRFWAGLVSPMPRWSRSPRPPSSPAPCSRCSAGHVGAALWMLARGAHPRRTPPLTTLSGVHTGLHSRLLALFAPGGEGASWVRRRSAVLGSGGAVAVASRRACSSHSRSCRPRC